MIEKVSSTNRMDLSMTFKHVVLSAILMASSDLAGCGGGYVAHRVPAPAPRVVCAIGFASGPGYEICVAVAGCGSTEGEVIRPSAVWFGSRTAGKGTENAGVSTKGSGDRSIRRPRT